MALKKLPKRYAGILMPFFLSIIMTGIISAINIGKMSATLDDFLAHWPQGWLYSWLVGFPVVLIVLPIVRRLVGLLVEA